MLRQLKPLTFLLIFSLAFAWFSPLALEAQAIAASAEQTPPAALAVPARDKDEPEDDADGRVPIDRHYPNVLIPDYESKDYDYLVKPWEIEDRDPTADRESFYERREEIHPDFFRLGIRYWADVACYGEFDSADDGYFKRWGKDIDLFIDGEPEAEDMEHLETLLRLLNSVDNTPQMTLVDSEDEASLVMHFDTYQNALDRFDFFMEGNNGFFWISWHGGEKIYQIYEGDIIITTDTRDDVRRHVIGEELIQSLGLMDDSYEFLDSIFQQAVTLSQFPNELDWLVIELHHRPEIQPGMTGEEAMQILADLYLDYVPRDNTVWAHRDEFTEEYLTEAVDTWLEAAYWSSDDVLARWVDPLYIAFYGDGVEDLHREILEEYVNQFRSLHLLPEIVIQDAPDFFTNVHIELDDFPAIADRHPWADPNWVWGFTVGAENFPYKDEVRFGEIFIDSNQDEDFTRHIILKLFLKVLGLMGEPRESIDTVLAADSEISELTPLDLLLVEMQYAPVLRPGMTQKHARNVLLKYYLEEIGEAEATDEADEAESEASGD